MGRSGRFSRAISGGNRISLIADVGDVASARVAEAAGARAFLVRSDVEGVVHATELPVLFVGDAPPDHVARAGAAACLVSVEGIEREDGRLERAYRDALDRGLECAVEVHDEDELRLALDRLDPDILVLSGRRAGTADALEHVLGLLPELPLGKLAVADLDEAGPGEVGELERAGFDAAVVGTGDVGRTADPHGRRGSGE
jgi:indole-3-glycerol phosphate synthase